MPGPANRSRYVVPVSPEKRHDDAKKLFDIPGWWSLDQYAATRRWTATRWLVEIEFRRRFYTSSRKGIQLWMGYNEESAENLVKMLYECIESAPKYNRNKLPEKQIDREVENGLHLSVYLTPLIKPLSDQVDSLIELLENETIPSSEILDLIRKWCPDLVTRRKTPHSLISVDLIGENPAIRESLLLWLEKEKPKSEGRPLGSFGQQQYSKWAEMKYLAYLDLRELIISSNKPLPKNDYWADLLMGKWNGEIDPAKAEWLLSDEVNGLLRVAAEKEGYLLAEGRR